MPGRPWYWRRHGPEPPEEGVLVGSCLGLCPPTPNAIMFVGSGHGGQTWRPDLAWSVCRSAYSRAGNPRGVASMSCRSCSRPTAMTPSSSRSLQSWCWKCPSGTPSKRAWRGVGGSGWGWVGLPSGPLYPSLYPLALSPAQTQAERGSCFQSSPWGLGTVGPPESITPP